MKNAEQEMEEEQFQHEQGMETEKHERQHREGGYKDYIKSLITYNKGGDWKRIKAPERDSEGKKYDCGEYCYLNLQGISSEYPPYYSVESAAGIIISNGNVGRYLSHDHESINTFLSRDGGLTWFEIKKGSHIYEIGDHGALILIADDQNPTKEIFYSWDEGLTFESLTISEEKFLIKNIIIEPSSTSQHFVIYGEKNKKGNTKGIVIGLDFTGLHEPQCRNPDNPDSSDSDYEKWTPNDGRMGHECLMGHKTIYIRRKRESQCYNGQLFERKTIVEHCDCTEDDYECDFGFARAAPGEPCVSLKKHSGTAGKDDNAEMYTPPANCQGYYKISRGYRKVPGNTCVNGVKFDPIIIPCPYSGIFASLGIVFFIIILAVLVVLIVVAFNKNLFSMIPIILPTGSGSSATPMSNKREYVNIVKYFIYY
jgi:Sortilin, neurotensin receptor 3,/Sortilin, neurotensin receptor 3, C-terminal